MIYYVIAIRMSPLHADDHQHIAQLRWRAADGSSQSTSTRAELIAMVRAGLDLRVRDAYGGVVVKVVNAIPPYLRTVKDGRLSDNLLSLPRF